MSDVEEFSNILLHSNHSKVVQGQGYYLHQRIRDALAIAGFLVFEE